MRRLKLMPLIKEIGELLNHPIPVLNPSTHLLFTRDDRIFGQFAHDRESRECGFPKHIEVFDLPPDVTVADIAEDDDVPTQYVRTDPLGYDIVYTLAGNLKKLVLPNDTTATNKAVKAYIDQLSDSTPVILLWE